MKFVYRYGLTAPTENADRVHAELRRAHAYRNVLVEIERGRRAAVRALDSEAIQELAATVLALDARCETLAMEMREKRRATRTRSESEADRESLTAARAVRKRAVAALWAARRAETHVDAIDLINERALELGRSARAHCGVYWGTYLLVEDAARDSARLPLWDLNGASLSDPRFVRWTGDAAVGVQIQGGMSPEEALAQEDTRLRIQAPPEGAWGTGPGRSERVRLAKQASVALRIGSEGSKPVWARWRLDMHRPLPAAARIKSATVHVRPRGPHSEWSLTVTLDVPDAEGEVLPGRTGTLAIDVGWRQIGEEIRFGVGVDAAGKSRDFRLDRGLLALEERQRAIESERSRRFDGTVAAVRAYVAGLSAPPSWIAEQARSMHAWRDPKKLAMLHANWIENRHAGDERVFGRLEAWWWADRNLWAQESLTGLQFLRRRRDLYRSLSARLTGMYGTIVLEAFDLRKIARRPATGAEEDGDTNATARANRQRVAVSEFRAALVNAARTRGTVVVTVPAADSTVTCNVCGLVQKFDAAAQIEHTCECGATWDQDMNAGRVLLTRWRERPSDAKIVWSARKPEKTNDSGETAESLYARRRRLRAEKEARMRTAREAGGNA